MSEKPAYNHQMLLAFSVVSNDRKGKDITPAMLRAALMQRIKDLDENNEWDEACGPPEDTYKVED
ncbi:hypothetical protein [Methylobacterium indicum]|uniref:Uncharacterized protein n=1 Tax=Methylobacterium indicum TaxID=1775910 RepID=A0A8H9CAT2_9HYPH|nr:hypothetical protein [Methylobacterium indicum]BCM87770.1 hypothetical protein mvi_62310 [Methylobacterium indicum]